VHCPGWLWEAVNRAVDLPLPGRGLWLGMGFVHSLEYV